MPPLPTPLPSLTLSASGRLLLLGALCYLAVGLVYLSLTGISGAWSRVHRREIGTGAAATVAAAAVWAVVVIFWPVPLVSRTVRAVRCRPGTAPSEELIWRGPRKPSGERPVVPSIPAQLATAPAAPLQLRVPPLWYRQDYEAVRIVFVAGRTGTAQAWASGLVDRSTLAFGPGHPCTRDAWELLAHIARVALAEHRPDAGSGPFPGPWVSDPLQDVDSVYLSPACPSSTAMVW